MYYIGVDLGGTNIAIGIVNEEFEIVKKGSTPTKPERGADPIIADMAALSKKLMEEMGIGMDEISFIGVATPGTANNVTGVVEYANNIPFLQLVNTKGEMTEETPWAGVFVKKADPMILEDLEKEGKLTGKFHHPFREE